MAAARPRSAYTAGISRLAGRKEDGDVNFLPKPPSGTVCCTALYTSLPLPLLLPALGPAAPPRGPSHSPSFLTFFSLFLAFSPDRAREIAGNMWVSQRESNFTSFIQIQPVHRPMHQFSSKATQPTESLSKSISILILLRLSNGKSPALNVLFLLFQLFPLPLSRSRSFLLSTRLHTRKVTWYSSGRKIILRLSRVLCKRLIIL